MISNTVCMWHPKPSRDENVFVLFQAMLTVEQSGLFRLELFGCSFFRLYIDGVELAEGPARFAPDHPE
ncbi:hypothetical protein [Paenibacillus koleovorans]|uniref:hypothetical protein n=1 Tax=Paenibacillus koleovorans TaxID=121608 RepID=UPI000FDB0865|nr:hypothetical protein [Paenibacillus koleovorans]